MCYRLRLFFWGYSLSFGILAISGCDANTARENVTSVQQLSENMQHVVPADYSWIPAGITGVCTLALGILAFLKERRKSNILKSAIVTKADQIDKLILSAAAQTENPGNVVTKFMKADTRLRDFADKKHLNTFDAVRKGLL